MNDSTASTRPAAVRFWLALRILLGLILAWQVLTVLSAGASRNLMFDGSMNLEIARSIAEGDGPRRMYDTADLFPPGVQSKEPYVLLGALVFKALGVGPFQAQLPNLIYFLLMLATVMVAVRHAADLTTALLAGALILATPGFNQYALNGYGEIPTLFFGIASLALVAWPGTISRHLAARCAVAGAFAGLAIATKVIGVVQVAAVAIVLCARVFAEVEGRLAGIVKAGAAFLAGVLTPLTLIELWRWHWLATDGYLGWWKFQWMSILSQSGAEPPSAQATIAAKIANHFNILSSELRMGTARTALLLTVSLAGGAFAYFSGALDKTRSRWLLLGLALIIGFYFPWWLAVVPTAKAWLRYIYIALACLAIISAAGVIGNLRGALMNRPVLTRSIHAVLAVAVIALYSSFLTRSIKNDVSFVPSDDVRATLYAANLISQVEPQAVVLGYGWYASPTVQLHSDRHFMDLTDWPIGRLTDVPAYLVADRAALATGIFNRTLDRYPHRAMMRSNPFAQVYSVDFSNPPDPFADVNPDTVLSSVDFGKVDYAATTGMEPYDPMGGRFVESDSEILLRYDGQPRLDVSGYMALPRFYRRQEPLSGRILVGNCPAIPIAFEQTGWKQFRLALTCRPAAGNVRIRILLDNVFDLPLLYDRQRAMLLATIGFAE